MDDYVLRYTEQADESESVPRWRVQIVDWWVMAGLGSTRREAKDALRANLEAYQRRHGSLPRPGTRVPLEFASDKEIRQYWATAHSYIAGVLGHDPDAIFVSDETSLWDFCQGDDLSKYHVETLERFGVDISDIESGNLVEIVERIENASGV